MTYEEIIAPDSAEIATFPVTVQRVIAAVHAKGGEVRMVCRGFAGQHLMFHLPCRYVGGGTGMRHAGAFGWYKGADGSNKIGSGVHDVRDALRRHRGVR
jgi:hypothetical protein